MKTVFVLQHSYSMGDCEEIKMIGVYASLSDAEAAVSRLRVQPGFKDYADGFHIDQYAIGVDHWQEGFIRIITIMMPLLNEDVDAYLPVCAEVLASGGYRIIRQQGDDNEHWAFAANQVVECEERLFEGKPCLFAVSLAGNDS